VTPWLVLLALAIALEIWGFLDGVRVVTLSRVVWRLRERWPWLAVAVAVFFVWLWWHWFGV
jgi:hypothetical protein